MAHTLTRHLKSQLLLIPSKQGAAYPTLREAKGKIIIKNTGSYHQFLHLTQNKDDLIVEDQENEIDNGEEILPTTMKTLTKLVDYSPEYIKNWEIFQSQRKLWQEQRSNFFKQQ